MLKKILFGTSNQHKLMEVKDIFKNYFDVVSLDDIELNIPEPDEPYNTFLENATHKAEYYAKNSKMLTICEDSGFCINPLDGFPGVYSKRFIDDSNGLENAFRHLQEMMKDKDTSAKFICSAVIFNPDNQQTFTGEGQVNGKVTFPPRGTSGFVYDHIFIPNGYDKTFSELGTGVKNKISHRKLAMEKLRDFCIYNFSF
jgi:XTP/dITP diphosphohydrolase